MPTQTQTPLPPMDVPSELDERLTELEVKASLAEDTLDRLNDVVIRQQAQIDLLMREVRRLSRQEAPEGGEPGFRSLRDEIPPHY